LANPAPFSTRVERASRAAVMNRPVLVIGERGTGKELIAERLHRLSSPLGRTAGHDELRSLARNPDRG
jgi:transcriptional regulator with AAA-type ATPase domain